MRRGNAQLDWQISEDNGRPQDWPHLTADIDAAAIDDQVQAGARLQRMVVGAALLTIALVAIGTYLHREAHKGLAQIEHDLQASIDLQERSAYSNAEARPQYQSDDDQSDHAPAHLGAQIQLQDALESRDSANVRIMDLNFHRDVAVATVNITGSGLYGYGQTLRYRQLRFYRRRETDWVRVEPDVAYFGKRQVMQTTHLTIHYRERDAALVATIVSELDAVYARLRTDLSLDPTAERLVFEIGAAGRPEFLPGSQDGRLVPSPALVQIPVEYTDQQILTLWFLGAIVQQALAKASQAAPFKFKPQFTEQILYQWQIRRHSGLLGAWNDDIMQRLYGSEANAGDYDVLVRQVNQLCTRHRFLASAQILHRSSGIGSVMTCIVPNSAPLAWLSRHGPPDRLAQLTVKRIEQYLFEDPLKAETSRDWIHDLAMMSVFDYVEAEYGPEQIRVLVEGFRRHATWDGLISAVFHKPVADFEADWQRFLAERYGGATAE